MPEAGHERCSDGVYNGQNYDSHRVEALNIWPSNNPNYGQLSGNREEGHSHTAVDGFTAVVTTASGRKGAAECA